MCVSVRVCVGGRLREGVIDQNVAARGAPSFLSFRETRETSEQPLRLTLLPSSYLTAVSWRRGRKETGDGGKKQNQSVSPNNLFPIRWGNVFSGKK